MHDQPEKTDGGDGHRGGGNAGVQQEVPLVTFPLRDSHRTKDFISKRSPEVEEFLRDKAPDLVRRNHCRVFVLENPDDRDQVWGYYSLSASQIVRENMNNKHRGSLGRRSAPMLILGYMGRDDSLPPKKYGPWLIQDAARRAIKARENLGIWGLMLEAENEGLAKWYEHPDRGFKRCPKSAELVPGRPPMYAPLEGFPLTA